jgi:hypothetical protein
LLSSCSTAWSRFDIIVLDLWLTSLSTCSNALDAFILDRWMSCSCRRTVACFFFSASSLSLWCSYAFFAWSRMCVFVEAFLSSVARLASTRWISCRKFWSVWLRVSCSVRRKIVFSFWLILASTVESVASLSCFALFAFLSLLSFRLRSNSSEMLFVERWLWVRLMLIWLSIYSYISRISLSISSLSFSRLNKSKID